MGQGLWWAQHSSYDFPAFYRAAGLVAHGHSPYLPSHHVDRDFLDGPLVGLLYAPLSLLSYETARLTAIAVGLCLVVVSAALLAATRPHRRVVVGAAFAVVVLLTVTGRAALGLGQTTALALLGYAIWYAAYRRVGLCHDLLAGLAGCLVFQVKPYLGVPLLLVALVHRRARLLAVALVSSAATVAAASLLAGQDLVGAWWHAVLDRQEGAAAGTDQVSVLAAVQHATGHDPALAVALALAAAATGWLVRTAWQGTDERPLLVAACWPLVASTFLHPQDLVLGCWPLTVLLLDREAATRRWLCGLLVTVCFLDVWTTMAPQHDAAYVAGRQAAYVLPLWLALVLAGLPARRAVGALAAALVLALGVPLWVRAGPVEPPWASGVTLAAGGLLLAVGWLSSSPAGAGSPRLPRARGRPSRAAGSTTVAP